MKASWRHEPSIIKSITVVIVDFILNLFYALFKLLTKNEDCFAKACISSAQDNLSLYFEILINLWTTKIEFIKVSADQPYNVSIINYLWYEITARQKSKQ